MTTDAAAGRRLVQQTRERFLASGDLVTAAGLREEIAASWRRSRLFAVAPDHLDVPYEPDLVNHESRLCRAAGPVMARFAQRLIDTPTGLFLADRHARGVQRWVGQPGLAGRFDAVGAANGFRFDEEIAGTNALGTTIELGRPVTITAAEHWVEQLNVLTCAGAPIRNPITRQIEGVVDLTCVNEHNADLLLALVQEIAYQVEERFYLDASIRERLMLQHFTSAARNSARPVMALNQDMILTNPAAARLIRGIDQEILFDLAVRVMHTERTCTESIAHGESGTVAHCAPIRDGGDVIGVTIELKPDRAGPRPGARGPVAASTTDLPGLVGRSPAWRSLCQQVHAASARRATLVVGGESGVGKLAVARAWCRLRGVEAPTVLDALTEAIDGLEAWVAVAQAALAGGHALVVTHAEALSDAAAAALGAAAECTDQPILALTVTTADRPPPAALTSLIYRVRAGSVEISPLRRRREDIVDLVSHFAGAGESACASEAVQLLLRLPWPRNAAELRHILDTARAARPTGALRLEDLPPGVRGGARRRLLSTMEQAELDTIVQALDDAAGNKADAAAALGIARSTLYRKMHSYGLDLDRAVF
jgi:transcriptional regulator of acetoin/glycerol metabolism